MPSRDALNRLGIALRYAQPPGRDGATLQDWREYAARVVQEAECRGLIVTVAIADPEDEATCAAEMRAEHDDDVRRMSRDE